MTVHLLKLAVGVASIDDLRESAQRRAGEAQTGPRAMRITTRSAPKRADEVLAGGSLYWVIKGSLQARQRVVGVEPFTDASGVSRVHILLDPEVTPVRPRPCRPFQGWRYLRADEAPADFAMAAVDEAMPAAMRRDLLELCLI